MTNRVIIGCFGSPFGVQGWIKISSYTNPIENILKYQHWQIELNHLWQDIDITAKKKTGNIIVAKIANCDDRDLARFYTNRLIAVDRLELPNLNQKEFYWMDLIGLKVVTTTGVELGIIENLLETGSNDVLIVQGERQRLIPYTTQTICNIDLDNKIVTVDWDPEF